MITLLLLVRATYIYGVVLRVHPVRGESRNQRNTTGEVATVTYDMKSFTFRERDGEIESLQTSPMIFWKYLNDGPPFQYIPSD